MCSYEFLIMIFTLALKVIKLNWKYLLVKECGFFKVTVHFEYLEFLTIVARD